MQQVDEETGEIRTVSGYPPAIAAAIVQVLGKSKQLGADSRNEHGKYGYVSVDKFYERVGPLMADAGIFLVVNEVETEIKVSDKSGNPWLWARYELHWVHASGIESTSVSRAVALPINGPQTYGSAQSYVEKQFLRQIFKIPTGDRDADETAQSEAAPESNRKPASARHASPPPPPARTAGDPQATPAVEAGRKAYDTVRRQIAAASTAGIVENVMLDAEQRGLFKTANAGWAQAEAKLREIAANRIKMLEAASAPKDEEAFAP